MSGPRVRAGFIEAPLVGLANRPSGATVEPTAMAALWPMLRLPVAVLRMTLTRIAVRTVSITATSSRRRAWRSDSSRQHSHHRTWPEGTGQRRLPRRTGPPSTAPPMPGGTTPRPAKPKVTAGLMSRQRAPSVDHGHDYRPRRDHGCGPADGNATRVMIDHPRSGRHRHQHERAQEFNDEPDPQWPLPEGIFLEPDEVAAPERCSVFGSISPVTFAMCRPHICRIRNTCAASRRSRGG